MEQKYIFLFYILPLFVLLFLIFSIVKARKKLIDYLDEIGAKIISPYTYPFIKAELLHEGIKVKLWISESGKLNIGLPIQVSGYLVLRKSDFFDKLFFQKRIDNLAVIYEDPEWANIILSLKDFRKVINELFSLSKIYSFSIKDKELIISWRFARGSSRFVEREVINEALTKLIKIINILKSIPSTSVKEHIRKWLVYKIPLIFSALLVIIGIMGRFYDYNPVCHLELIIKGYKLLSPFLLSYILFTILLVVRNRTLLQGTLGNLFLVWSISSLFIILFFISYINGRFDTSQPSLKKDYIKRKYIGYTRWNSGPQIVLAEFSKRKPWWCDNSFRVSRAFYEKVKVGDRVEYVTGKGFFGIEWFYSGLKISE